MGQLKLIFLALILLPVLVAQAQQLPRVAVPEGEQRTPHPRLVVEANRHNFGDISPGTTVTHVFLIENKGQAPLDILEVKPGCGCSNTEFDSQIAPGDTGRISLSVNIYREWAGQEISKSAWVLTNDPLAPQFRLTLTGQVRSFDQPTEPIKQPIQQTEQPAQQIDSISGMLENTNSNTDNKKAAQ